MPRAWLRSGCRTGSRAPGLLAILPAFVILLGGGCSTVPAQADAPIAGDGLATMTVVGERWVSPEMPGDELDSLVTWDAGAGRTWLIATAKSSHRLVVFDAGTGERLRDVGGKGSGPGQFLRPNGLAIHDDRLFLTERDNQRVQVLSLPDFRPLGSFGHGELRSPYGLWINDASAGGIDIYVTDSFMDGPRYDVVPSLDRLGERVRRYRVDFAASGSPQARYVGAFGDTSAEAALRMVESIAGDPAHDRLLIADEDRRHRSTLREYTLAGHYTGRSLPGGSFEAEAEGIALWACGGADRSAGDSGRGYWIAVDQLAPLSKFHLFDRITLQPRGSFRGQRVAHTDGITLDASPSSTFPHGALYAVHDDRAVAAFDLGDVIAALDLDRGCLP